MSSDQIAVQLAHVLRQLRPGELVLVEVLQTGVADRVGALNARMALKSRRRWRVLRLRRADRRTFSVLRDEEPLLAEAESLREDPCWKCQRISSL